MARWLVLVCLLLPQTMNSEPAKDKLIVWNVGQGLWMTVVSESNCVHVDMGGEFAPFARIKIACQNKQNSLYLSHWDLDHYRFINRFQRFVSSLCLASGPLKPQRLFTPAALPFCDRKMSNLKTIWQSGNGKTQNEKGFVYYSGAFRTVFPGDSPRKQEIRWAKRVPKELRFLILGHHGSRTATSAQLLKQLENAKQAIVSARKVKYGHPHKETVERLKRFHIPLISTEDWGNLIFIGEKISP